MRKIYTFVALSLLFVVAGRAEVVGDFTVTGNTPNSYLTAAATESYEFENSVCMGLNDTLTVSIDAGIYASAKSFSWVSRGSIAIIGDTRQQTVRVVSTSYGKGRVLFYYRTGDCNTSTSFDIFKSFSGSEMRISGPDCFSPGDVVVMSVNPILTENLNHQIGIDYYYWNVTATPKPSFVDSIVYEAGDGSSVTFVAGEVGSSDQVTVNFGVCNRATPLAATLNLGKKAPKPEVNKEECVVYGEGKVLNLSVQNPVAGVAYSWWCANAKWQFNSTVGTSVQVTLDKESDGSIICTASFEGTDGCGGTSDTITVSREWGNDVTMSCKENDNDNLNYHCQVGNRYEFRLEGETTSTEVEWVELNGWSVAPNSPTKSTNIFLIPGAGAALRDTVRARVQSCSAAVGYKEVNHVVYVKPAAVSDITVNETCLSPDSAYTFRAVQGNNGPQAASYTWEVKMGNTYVPYSNFTGDSLRLIVTTDMQAVRVRPNGLDGCDGEFSEDKALVFKPAAPEGILFDGCIAYNMPDTVTFSIVNPVANQQYAWTLPAGWTQVATHNNGQSVDVRTTGVAGTYTVSAYGVGSGTCGNSVPAIINATINNVEKEIIYTAATELFSVFPTRPRGTNYYWYLVYNGHIVGGDNVFYDNDNTALAVSLSDDYFDLSENLINSTEYTLVLEFEVSSGCKARLTYGAPLSSNIDYKRTTPVSPLRAQRYMKTREIEGALNSPTLLVSPNPVSHALEVKLNDGSEFSMKILSVDAEPLYTDDTMLIQHNIDVSSYPTGTYIVIAFQNGKRVAMERFIKQ